MVDCHHTEDVEFDADIAGLGVSKPSQATFLALMSFAAFVTLSVPSRLLNTGDAVMACGVRLFRRQPSGDDPKLNQVNTRNERIDAYKAFLHSTSDQILVSQAAILIAATIIHEEITIYSANIVIALGCLASTVHLGCFPFYADRLRDHDTAKLLRVLAMTAGSAILVFMLMVQLSDSWDEYLHMTCALIPLTVLYGTYEIIQLLYKQPHQDDEAPGKRVQSRQRPSRTAENASSPQQGTGQDIEMQALQIPVPRRLYEYRSGSSSLFLSKIEREALAVYEVLRDDGENDANNTNGSENSYDQLRLELFQRTLKKRTMKETREQTREEIRPALLNKWLQLEALKLLIAKPQSRDSLRARVYMTAERWAYHQCRGSFVWRILWLWSGNVYGITTVIISRSTVTGLEGDPDHWGFGQVVPLALLALPIFAAMEGHAEYKRQVQARMHKQQEASRRQNSLVISPMHDPTAGSQRTQDAMSRDEDDALQFVEELLRNRARSIGYPFVYDWLQGVRFEEIPTLQAAAGCQATFIFLMTTLLGLCMALGTATIGTAPMIVVLLLVCVIMPLRRAVELVMISKTTRNLPQILSRLGGGATKEPVQVGDYGWHMMTAQAVGETEQDAENDHLASAQYTGFTKARENYCPDEMAADIDYAKIDKKAQ
ncbi:unnamed protein product [Fusarium equiseti]|uniref:Uncharacterized protein n=1 Tax=Fusarium equiseti TaxID=61235 RepID=A0A8J2IML8_FUSEQ|nr:unnamed protein product [Fusarium equiseti]